MKRIRLHPVLLIFALMTCALSTTACTAKSDSGSDNVEPVVAATVHIRDGEFDPRVISVSAGGSVTWINDDSSSHSLKFLPPTLFASGDMKPTNIWTQTFDSAGTFDYYCDFRNSMKGSVVVRSSP
ncbi:MAG: cupredoxin domain-containing protein [Acidimicrobiales bacterium]